MKEEIRLGRFDKWGYKNSFSKGELARELTYMNRDYDNLQSQLKAKEETINKAIKHVSSLSSKGRGCEIYADVKRDILEILSKGENK